MMSHIHRALHGHGKSSSLVHCSAAVHPGHIRTRVRESVPFVCPAVSVPLDAGAPLPYLQKSIGARTRSADG